MIDRVTKLTVSPDVGHPSSSWTISPARLCGRTKPPDPYTRSPDSRSGHSAASARRAPARAPGALAAFPLRRPPASPSPADGGALASPARKNRPNTLPWVRIVFSRALLRSYFSFVYFCLVVWSTRGAARRGPASANPERTSSHPKTLDRRHAGILVIPLRLDKLSGNPVQVTTATASPEGSRRPCSVPASTRTISADGAHLPAPRAGHRLFH